jgi:hypothetical protein
MYSEVVEKFPDLRHSITERLLQSIPEIKSGKVFRGALWIVGEYCSGPEGQSAAHFLSCPSCERRQISERPSVRFVEQLERFPS